MRPLLLDDDDDLSRLPITRDADSYGALASNSSLFRDFYFPVAKNKFTEEIPENVPTWLTFRINTAADGPNLPQSLDISFGGFSGFSVAADSLKGEQFGSDEIVFIYSLDNGSRIVSAQPSLDAYFDADSGELKISINEIPDGADRVHVAIMVTAPDGVVGSRQLTMTIGDDLPFYQTITIQDVVQGTDADETLYGTAANEYFDPRGGRDVVWTGLGADTIFDLAGKDGQSSGGDYYYGQGQGDRVIYWDSKENFKFYKTAMDPRAGYLIVEHHLMKPGGQVEITRDLINTIVNKVAFNYGSFDLGDGSVSDLNSLHYESVLDLYQQAEYWV